MAWIAQCDLQFRFESREANFQGNVAKNDVTPHEGPSIFRNQVATEHESAQTRANSRCDSYDTEALRFVAKVHSGNGQYPRHPNDYMLRVVETVVLENGRFVPAKNRWFWWKLAEILILHSTHKNKGFCPQTPEIDENDENGGCHPDKMTVCQKHRFDNPDMQLFLISGISFLMITITIMFLNP